MAAKANTTMHHAHQFRAMNAKRTTASPARAAVSWLGRLKTGGRFGVIVVMRCPSSPDPCPRSRGGRSMLAQHSCGQVVPVGPRNLGAEKVPGADPPRLEAHHAVDVRGVGIAA